MICSPSPAAAFLFAILVLVVGSNQAAGSNQLESFFYGHVKRRHLMARDQEIKSGGRVGRRRHEYVDELDVLFILQIGPCAAHGKGDRENAGARVFDQHDLTLRVRLTEKGLNQFLNGGIDAAKHRNLCEEILPEGQESSSRHAPGKKS